MNWDWQRIIAFLIGMLIGVVLHEYMHGRIADWRGDPTARNAGRITLNPVAPIDLFGTILMPIGLLLISRGSMLFGYAKPVPVNQFFLKKPKRDMVLIALAGPLTNFVVAIVLALMGLLLRVVFNASLASSGVWGNLLVFFYYAAAINILLAVFNLLPIPPLDGSHVVQYFLPPRAQRVYMSIAPYGFIIIFAIIMIFDFVFAALMSPFIKLINLIMFGTT